MTKKLDFIICGVQKSGTNTLHGLLSTHPDIAVGQRRELHLFDDQSVDWEHPDYAAYHHKFGTADETKLWGECTPVYIYMPGCLERIRAYNPAVKLIAIFRDPVDRAFSGWCMEYARHADTMLFADAIREGRSRVAAAPGGWHRVYSYVERGYYGRQVERLLSIFPKDQFLAVDFSDLKVNQQAVLDAVSDFLGIRRAKAPTELLHKFPKAVFDYPSALTDRDEHYLASLYADDSRTFRQLTGLTCRSWS